jgi:thiamine-phosphate diphosphorylase
VSAARERQEFIGYSPAQRRAWIEPYLPALMLVTDPTLLRGRHITDVVRHSLDGGVNLVQVRDKRSSARLLTLADEVLDAAKGRALVLVNGSFPVAATVEVRLHLPESSDVPSHWQKRGPEERPLYSRSVHSVAAARRAAADCASILVLGTVFPSSSHPGGATIGLDGVREVCAAVSIPVIGIGGITVQNAGDVIRAGASGVAVISAIFDAPDPRAAAAELRAAIDAAWAKRHGRGFR